MYKYVILFKKYFPSIFIQLIYQLYLFYKIKSACNNVIPFHHLHQERETLSTNTKPIQSSHEIRLVEPSIYFLLSKSPPDSNFNELVNPSHGRSIIFTSLAIKLYHPWYFWSLSLDSMETRVANKFRLGRKIGSGSFGEIFLGMWNSRLIYTSRDS